MEGSVQAAERLSCFLVHSTDFKLSQGRPTYSAYMPASNGRKSVYRTQGLSSDEIREIGRICVEPMRGPLKGYADQAARVVLDVGLTLDPDRRPHPRHANICGWSADRAANRIKAEKIAATATIFIYGTSGDAALYR
jgi:hypothetical protein